MNNNGNYRRNYNIPYIYDFGPSPLVFNIEKYTKYNENFRTAIWTGGNMQLTLMSIPVMGEIGVEMHPEVDQFIRIEDGNAVVKMGNSRDNLNYQKRVDGDFAIIVPAGTWHNVVNIGNTPLKIYTIYAPPQHPFGTVHVTKEDSENAENQSENM